MTNQEALNGTEIDRPHYVEALKGDTTLLQGAIVVGVLAAFSPLPLGGYGFNWQTILSVLIFALAVWIVYCKAKTIGYSKQMIAYRRKSKSRRRTRRTNPAAQTA